MIFDVQKDIILDLARKSVVSLLAAALIFSFRMRKM